MNRITETKDNNKTMIEIIEEETKPWKSVEVLDVDEENKQIELDICPFFSSENAITSNQYKYIKDCGRVTYKSNRKLYKHVSKFSASCVIGLLLNHKDWNFHLYIN